MAKVKRNVVVRGISGVLGRDLVFRQMRDGSTRISVRPDFSRRAFSSGQLSHQSRFRLAARYARGAAKTNPIYAELAKGTTKNAYNIALSDWFNPPVIQEIRCEEGRVRVQASDDVCVARVVVMVLGEEGGIRERAEAVKCQVPGVRGIGGNT